MWIRGSLQYCRSLPLWTSLPQRRKGQRRNRRSLPALSDGAYTTTLLVMVDRVKGGGRVPPHSAGWAEFTIMIEYTPESGHCRSIWTLLSVVNANPATVMGSLPASCNKNKNRRPGFFCFCCHWKWLHLPLPANTAIMATISSSFFLCDR